MLMLAMSCLQGRPMSAVAQELLSLGADGLQLTPGNAPTAHFLAEISDIPTRTHHGFHAYGLRQQVWSDQGELCVQADSVHPPSLDSPAALGWWQQLERWVQAKVPLPIFETMLPGYHLGSGPELDGAMQLGLALAVDISHIHILREQGLLDAGTWRRLQDYDNIKEVHLSANDGSRDAHHPVTDRTFGLQWARAQMAAGVPGILECYMHHLCKSTRRRQLDIIRC